MAKVLIADDEENIRFSFGSILTEAGHDVIEAENLSDARSSLDTTQFDVAVVDRLLGPDDGMDLVKQINTTQPFCTTILVSAYPNFKSASEGFEHRLFAYLQKPVKMGKLLSAVEIAAQNSSEKQEHNISEQQLVQTQKMETLGELTGGIAHDFNNLLTVILGNAGCLLMKNEKDSENTELIEEIRKAGTKAADLTRQLLSFSRNQVIHPRVLDFNLLLKNSEKILTRLIGENIEVKLILNPELWDIKMDPGQVDQVIMNLAANAGGAMPWGRQLTIETTNVNLGKNHFKQLGFKPMPGKYVLLTVRDTGLGMDEETLKQIFDLFFTTKEEGKGTGMGLSTVKRIVEQNKGFIGAESEPGLGTRFKIYLPKAKEKEEINKNGKTGRADLTGSETILLVEDDDNTRKVIKKALQHFGYNTLTAQNGEDAFRVIMDFEGPIHLMLTDVIMPEMGGKKLSDRIQMIYPEISVIYMSGHPNDLIVSQGILEMEDNFLKKPFLPEVLGEKIRDELDKK